MTSDLMQPFTVPLIDSAGAPSVATKVPVVLQEVLEANQHLKQRFISAIGDALQRSFEHPDTKMRELTTHEVSRRTALAYKAVIMMYFEEKMSLIRACDILPTVLIDALRMGHDVESIADGRGGNKRWVVPGSEQLCEADLSSDATEE